MKAPVPKARTVIRVEKMGRVRHLQQADQLDALHNTSAQETCDIDAIFVLNLEQAHASTIFVMIPRVTVQNQCTTIHRFPVIPFLAQVDCFPVS
jgi:hypothetical protein